jgi:hypothetical protein
LKRKQFTKLKKKTPLLIDIIFSFILKFFLKFKANFVILFCSIGEFEDNFLENIKKPTVELNTKKEKEEIKTKNDSDFITNLNHQKDTINEPAMNTFGRSNTLDRKQIKQINNARASVRLQPTQPQIKEHITINNDKFPVPQPPPPPQPQRFQPNNHLSSSLHPASFLATPQRNSLNLTVTNPLRFDPNNKRISVDQSTSSILTASHTTKQQFQSLKLKHKQQQQQQDETVLILDHSDYTDDENKSIDNANEKFIQQLVGELETSRHQIFNLNHQLTNSYQIVSSLEQTICDLKGKLQFSNEMCHKKDKQLAECKVFFDSLQTKYPKLLLDINKPSFNTNSISSIVPPLPPRCLLVRSNSTDSLNSSISQTSSQYSSFSSQTTATTTTTNSNKKIINSPSNNNKRNWFRSSFTKAFRKSAITSQNHQNSNHKSLSDVDENESIITSLPPIPNNKQFDNTLSLPNTPIHYCYSQQQQQQQQKTSNYEQQMNELERILHEKELKLTDIRLESLATAHQLDSTKEDNLKLKCEIEMMRNKITHLTNIIESNENKIETSTTTTSSSPSPSGGVSFLSLPKKNLKKLPSPPNNRDSSASSTSASTSSSSSIISPSSSTKIQLLTTTTTTTMSNSGKRVIVSIFTGDKFDPIVNTDDGNTENQIIIGSINLNTRTNWSSLDGIVKRVFNEYITRLDKGQSDPNLLGLNGDSIVNYYVGEMGRLSGSDCELNSESDWSPDLLPYGYLVGNNTTIVIKLKDNSKTTQNGNRNNSFDSLAIDTLTPKYILNRYVSLLVDHKHLLFCGPSGTGKSYLVKKIAHYLTRRHGLDINDETIVYYNGEGSRTSKDLKYFLQTIMDRNVDVAKRVHVLVLDNLSSCINFADVFDDYFDPLNCHKRWLVYLTFFYQ